jgi:hypothetical protein
MEKFAVNLDNFKEEVFFECILQKSAVAVKYSFKDFYTHDGEPRNWKQQFLTDVHDSKRVEYCGEVFFVHCSGPDAGNRICYIFYGGKVYSFDPYHTDCAIFESIVKSNYENH